MLGIESKKLVITDEFARKLTELLNKKDSNPEDCCVSNSQNDNSIKVVWE